MKRPLIISAGIVGVLVGLGFIFPAVALMRTTGSLPNTSVGLLLLGIGLTLGGVRAAFCGAKGRAA